MSTVDSSDRFHRFANVQSIYRSYGEYVADEGIYFGNRAVVQILQVNTRVYRLIFSPDDNGMYVSAALILEIRGLTRA